MDMTARTQIPKVVIVLHGIRTRGTWQRQLAPILAKSGFIPELLDYGWFGALPFLVPALRRRKVKWFLDQYQEIQRKYPGVVPSVIAHSFGTYIACRALQVNAGLIAFDKLILCGSILRQDYNWPLVFEKQLVENVLNDCGRLDVWAGNVQHFVRDAGPSGRDGFAIKCDGKLVEHFHPEWGHSDFFFDLNFENRWVRYLKAEGVQEIEFPPTGSVPKALIAVGLVLLTGCLWILYQSGLLNGKSGILDKPSPSLHITPSDYDRIVLIIDNPSSGMPPAELASLLVKRAAYEMQAMPNNSQPEVSLKKALAVYEEKKIDDKALGAQIHLMLGGYYSFKRETELSTVHYKAAKSLQGLE